MIRVLVGKILQDLRLSLLVTATLLCLFQVFWAKIMERIIAQLAPFFHGMAGNSGIDVPQIEKVVFDGPGKLMRTFIGGDAVDLNNAMDMFSVGYIHPLVQTILCIWAIGRAAGALAGEIDRGTMELLLSQPVGRGAVIFAHLIVDMITIPILCLSLWLGSAIGCALVSPLTLKEYEAIKPMKPLSMEVGLGGLKFSIKDRGPVKVAPRIEPGKGKLELRGWDFGRGMLAVGTLLFSITGMTMAISAAGRFRTRVLGFSVFLILIMFLTNVIGQVWEPFSLLRPFTIFYYYQPQPLILGKPWVVTLSEWNHGSPLISLPFLLVLAGVGGVGYAVAARIFTQRDIPAPI